MTPPRPWATCLCSPDKPCVACPLAHPCGCGAAAGQRCRRPSGHRGAFVATHEDRLLRSDADAIAHDAGAVQASLRAALGDPDARKAWARALRGLRRRPDIWTGRIAPEILEQLVALADPAAHAAAQQLTLLD